LPSGLSNKSGQILPAMPKVPWNKELVVGQKRAFTPEQIEMLRSVLQRQSAKRDLALLELGISTMLRSIDLLRLRIKNVFDDHGNVVRTFTIRQAKTGELVTCDISKKARDALEAYVATWHELDLIREKKLFHMCGTTYSRTVKLWATIMRLDPEAYSTHSVRRTLAAHIYAQSKDIEAIRQCLGHKSLAYTQAYLGVSHDQALEIKRKFDL